MSKLQVYTSAPTDQRLPKEMAVYQLLDQLGIFYERVDHPAIMTMEAGKAVNEALNIHIYKNLFLRNKQKTKFYLLVMPDDKTFDTKSLRGQHGIQRLSFASEEYMQEMLNVTPGSVTIMGLMHDKENRVQLLIDEDLLKEENFGFHPCINTSSLKAATKDILEKYLPAVQHDYLTVTL